MRRQRSVAELREGVIRVLRIASRHMCCETSRWGPARDLSTSIRCGCEDCVAAEAIADTIDVNVRTHERHALASARIADERVLEIERPAPMGPPRERRGVMLLRK